MPKTRGSNCAPLPGITGQLPLQRRPARLRPQLPWPWLPACRLPRRIGRSWRQFAATPVPLDCPQSSEPPEISQCN
eukprot:scaffold663122_cov29-Prasinocladus_malaysianus.AAC.1